MTEKMSREEFEERYQAVRDRIREHHAKRRRQIRDLTQIANSHSKPADTRARTKGLSR